ncbi:hypothetical protein CTAYLR_008869 [Chrysophaeum taylorii]|uniref:Uncharacterized protein n=1 Tax=Chrysophaeum taylorii TaxID=2483200 RepID=A0AAD7U6B2_9STRA|nr:hypothetical protein CTAYLR_008869 [Chrysophaeum taylorii]
MLSFAVVLAMAQVFVRLSPLVGGPKFLRVHTACFVEEDDLLVGFDFLPANPTSPETFRRLLTLQPCPGIVRELRVPRAARDLDDFLVPIGDLACDLDAMRDLALNDREEDLHLLTNPCWRHSFALAQKATGRSAWDVAWALAAHVLASGPSDARPLASRRRDDAPPPDATRLERAFEAEKARRFGVDIADLLSDEDRSKAARAARSFQQALEREERDPLASPTQNVADQDDDDDDHPSREIVRRPS